MKNILNDSIVLIHVKGPSISTTTPAKTHIDIVSPEACLISVCRVLVKKATWQKVKPKQRKPIMTYSSTLMLLPKQYSTKSG